MDDKIRQKRKLSWENAGPYVVAFLVPVFVMLVVFIERKIWPLGERSFLSIDLGDQMVPFYKELWWKLRTGGSLLYSWNIGGGTNYWVLSAYYNASPWSLLVGLVPERYVIEFVTGSIVIKIALSSLTMAYYQNKRQDRHGSDRYLGTFIGCFYALSGWMAANNWVIMWLDCIWLFPLVILGLERLVKENKGLLYAITLSATIFCNYYIGLIVCMGIAVYCFFLLGTEREIFREFGIKLLKFIFYTLLAVAGAAVILIPYIRYFSMTESSQSVFNWEWQSYFPVFSVLDRMLIGVDWHKEWLNHSPNIYSGMAVFILVPLYYLNRKISLREKIGYTIVLLFFLFSFSTSVLDYIWHGFHLPNSLPCRQSFIFILIILTMSCRGFIGLEERTWWEIGLVTLLALGFVLLAGILETDKVVFTKHVFYVSAVFIVVYAIIFFMFRQVRLSKWILMIVLIAVCFIENVVNTSDVSVLTVHRKSFTAYDSGILTAMKQIRNDEGKDSFYRVEKTSRITHNDGAWLHFPSISTFSSVANAHMTNYYRTIGLKTYTNVYTLDGQTFLTNMLMGVKYTIAPKKLPDSDLYSLTYTNGSNVWVYENAYTLPVGYVFTDPNSVLAWDDNSSTPLENQNGLVRNLLGDRTLFQDVTPQYPDSTTVSLKIAEAGFYYAYAVPTGPKSIQVLYSSNNLKRTFESVDYSYSLELGWCNEGEILTFLNTEEGSAQNIVLSLYRMDEEVLKAFYEAASIVPLTVEHFEDTRIIGHIDVPQGGGLLFTTIAAEEGWELYVDGEKTNYQILKDVYIGCYLDEGYHELEFRFHVPLLLLSAIISGISWIIMIIIGIYPYAQKFMNKQKEKEK